MTNKEKYREELEKIISSQADRCKFLRDNILKTDSCTGISCGVCWFNFAFWLSEEYKDPEVDWSKIPVDTEVEVCICGVWEKRHFSGLNKNGNPTCFSGGRTSFTEKGKFEARPQNIRLMYPNGKEGE